MLQLPEEQLEQEPPLAPGMVLGTPPRLALNAAKVDILRRAGRWHFGQSAGWSDWLSGRICSNPELQTWQTYSYIGMMFLLFIV